MGNDFLVIFGTHPTLSLAELMGWAEARGVGIEVPHFERDAAVVSAPRQNNFALTAMHDLGGVVKIGEVLRSAPAKKNLNEDKLADELALLIADVASAASLTFGISFYGASNACPSSRTQERIALTVKKALRKNVSHVRWVSGRGQPLTSVQVAKNKLDRDGVELLVFITRETFVVARTLHVQAFEDWGRRDFGRPRRNAKQGMLPPKIARLMVNLLGTRPRGILLDPFCGSGTVLTEAAFVGWKNLMGSDINPRAIDDTKKNFLWLQRDEPALENTKLTMHALPIEKLLSQVAPNSISAIVTEPFLGPPLKTRASNADLLHITRELLPLYRESLNVVARLLEIGGRAVVVFPVWKAVREDARAFLLVQKSIPETLREHQPLAGTSFAKTILRYERPDQFVGREFVVFEKVSGR